MRSVGYKTKLIKRRVKIGHSELRTARLSSPKSHYSKLLSKNEGFTLIEIIIVIVILSIISAISIKFLVDSLRIYTMTANQKTLFDEGKLALERMCRDIRDARSIATPNQGQSDTTIRFRKNSATAYDSVNEDLRFQLSGTTLEKSKQTPNVTVALASNVSTFTVSRANSDEITIVLTLTRGTGERVTLRTKVYPKNLVDNVVYKTFFQSWREELSS